MNYIREAITQQHIGEEAIALRRHLHAHPDLSEQEFPTMELVCEHLEAAGIPYERNVAESGVVGLIKGSFPGPVIALRADMDALPMDEENDHPFKSQNPGAAHTGRAILLEDSGCDACLRSRRAYGDPFGNGKAAPVHARIPAWLRQAFIPAGRGDHWRRSAHDRAGLP